MTALDDGFPLYVPDTNDTQDFPHSILKDQDTDATTDHPTMGNPATGVVDTFYGIQDQLAETYFDELGPSSLVEVLDPEHASQQDARFNKGLVVLTASARDAAFYTIQASGTQAQRIVRENRYRRTVVITNTPAPVGDGVSVLWVAQTQANARVGVGFPIVAGASLSLDYSGDVWAFSSNAAGSLVSVAAPVFIESLQ